MVDSFDMDIHMVDTFFLVDTSGRNAEGGRQTGLERKSGYLHDDLFIVRDRRLLHCRLWKAAMSQQRQGME